MKLLSVAACDEFLNDQIAKVEAIIENAKTEERDLTEEENQVIDNITDEVVPGIQSKRDRLHKIENLAINRVEHRIEQGDIVVGDQSPGNDGASLEPYARVTVPASNRVHGTLRAFKGADGEKEAYVTGRWFAANFMKHEPSAKWLNDHGFQNALSGSNNDSAGVLVPVETATSIIRLVEEYGVTRRECSIEPMGSDRKVIPVRVSGMTAYPVAETTTANEGSNTGTKSEPTYKNIELVARKWKAWCKMSDELNEDAFVDMGDQIAVESALAFAYSEDNACFNGDGGSTYHGITGILNAVNAGSISTAATGNTAFSSLDMSDFETMVGKLPDFGGIDPKWYITKQGYYASMHRLLMAAGGNDSGNVSAGGAREFLGYPVVFTKVLNKTLTAQVDTKLAVFGDLRMGVKFGDRRMMSLSLTDQRYWDEDQIGIKAVERFDINVHSTGDASNEGSVLVLQTPSS